MADVTIGPSFDLPAVTGPCGFSFGLPKFSFSFTVTLPDLPAIPALPSFNFAFNLSCDPSKPIDISAGLPYGGGREAHYDPDPDHSDDF